MRLCLYIRTGDRRASTGVMVVPVSDVMRVMRWRAACRICDWLGLRARTEHDTHRIRLWVQTRTIRACLRTRNLLQEWPKQ